MPRHLPTLLRMQFGRTQWITCAPRPEGEWLQLDFQIACGVNFGRQDLPFKKLICRSLPLSMEL